MEFVKFPAVKFANALVGGHPQIAGGVLFDLVDRHAGKAILIAEIPQGRALRQEHAGHGKQADDQAPVVFPCTHLDDNSLPGITNINKAGCFLSTCLFKEMAAMDRDLLE